MNKLYYNIIVIILFISFINSASAFEFDNVLSVINTGGKYPDHKIVNSFGLGSDIVKMKIVDDGQDCFINCYAIINITLYEDNALPASFDSVNGAGKPTSKLWNYYTLNADSKDIIDQHYVWSCNDIVLPNTTVVNRCIQINDYNTTREEITYDWNKYRGEVMRAGVYTFKIEAKKTPTEKTDWSFSYLGISSNDIRQHWAWWDATWSKRKQINITGGGENLTDFPVFLNVTYDSDMQTDYDDLRFIDGECTGSQTDELDYEIQGNSSNAAQVWLRVSLLKTGVNNPVCMYYDADSVGSGQDLKGTWRNSYVLVFHLEEQTGFYKDSFQGNNASVLAAASRSIAGVFGGYAVQFDGSGDYANTSGTATSHPLNVTLEAWGYTLDNAPAANKFIVHYEKGGDATANMYQLAGTLKFIHDANLGGTYRNLDSGKSFTAAQWNHAVAALESGAQRGYINKVMGTATNHAGDLTYDANAKFIIGTWSNAGVPSAAQSWNGYIDEVRVSNVTRLAAWTNRSYDNANMSMFVFGAEDYTNGLTVTLNSPATNNLTTSNTVVLNCSGFDDVGVLNLTLLIDGFNNYTITGGAGQNLSIQATRTLSEGSHNWTCRVSDGTGVSDPLLASIRTLIIDQTPPTITLIHPNSTMPPFKNYNNIALNFTVADSLASSRQCNYSIDGGSNISLFSICNSTTTVTSSSLFNTTTGFHRINFFADDQLGNYRTANISFYVYNISSISPNVLEGENTTIYFYVLTSNLSSYGVNITYNYTLYNMPLKEFNGTTYTFHRSFIIPPVSENTLLNITFNYTLNGFKFNSTATQLIYNYPPFVFANNCTPRALTFYIYDEENLTQINGDLEYNFWYGTTNSSFINSYGSISATNNLSVCVNGTISPNYTISSGEIHYRSTGYVDRRYYVYDGTVIYNSSEITVKLHDLLTASQTSFKLEAEDTSLNPYINKYTALYRWYPNLNEYRIVDMGKTDILGTTVIHVNTEDTDYRVGIYELNGTLIYLDDPTRMICLVDPCTYTLKVSPSDSDYTSFQNIQYTFTFNETTGIWSFVYSDPSLKTTSMNMTVYKDTPTTSYVICTDSSNANIGVLTCNTSAYLSGIQRAIITRESSPPVTLTVKIHQFTDKIFNKPFTLWLMFLIGVPIVLFFAFVSPVAAIIGGVIIFIPALYFGVINFAIFGGIAVLAGIILFFLKRIG